MSYLLLIFALVHASLLAWTFRWPEGASAWLWLLRALLLGMVLDNSIQGLGQFFAESAALEGLNALRYYIHAAALPWLTLFGLSIMRRAGVSVASNRLLAGVFVLFTVSAVAWGLYHDGVMLELKPQDSYGVVKYVSTSKIPPIGTILTNVLLLGMGVAVWRAAGWPWLFAGSLFIFILNGATGSQPWGFMVGNFAEVVFITSLLATERHFGLSASR